MGGFQYANDMSVPAVDSADNVDSSDVLGSKLDTHDGNSVRAILHILNEHTHKSSKVYPTLANGVVVTAGAAWVLGAFAEIVPISTIATDFDIHHISVEALSANEVYELVLYAVEVEIARVRLTKNANLDGTMNVPVQCPILPANTQIKAKLATEGGSDTATMSIYYHLY